MPRRPGCAIALNGPRAVQRAGRAGHDVRPVRLGDTLALVDRRPVCHACGRPVEPCASDAWRHARGPGVRAFRRWLAPVDLREALRIPSYEAFVDRYPWTVHPTLGGHGVTTRADWMEALARLARYREALGVVGRWRSLRSGENPCLELVAILGAPSGTAVGDEVGAFESATSGDGRWPISRGVAQVLALPQRRRELAARFAWAIPTDGAVRAIVRHAPLLEGGAGTGYWAALVAGTGADVVAVDLDPPSGGGNAFHGGRRTPWFPVQRQTTVKAVRRCPDRTLVLVWPPHGDDAASYDALRAYRGERLIVVGEASGGATGSIRFHRELARNWTPGERVRLPTWPGLSDRLVVYDRNPERRPLVERDRCPGCRRFVPTGSLDRCARCIARLPPALGLLVDGSRVEYTADQLEALPVGLRVALERSPSRVR